MLVIEGLQVVVGGKLLLKRIDLEIRPGETHVLFGPNGSGKTSLLMAIMGFPQYKILGGSILFKGRDITALPIQERARLGLGMSFQRPPTMHGLKTRQMVELCAHGRVDAAALARQINMEHLLDREVNAGLSGGEIKRSELLQLMAQDPDLLLFDEPESGVDLENIALVGRTVAWLLQKDEAPAQGEPLPVRESRKQRTKMGLIITHTGHILNYLEADRGHVLFDGQLCCLGNPREILGCIGRFGYEECLRCLTVTG